MTKIFERYRSAPNLVNVCIDGWEDRGSRGRMYCFYEKEAVPFENEYQLLTMMDDMMERIGYPQAAVEMRSYRRTVPEKKEKPERVLTGDEVMAQRGKLATFLIQVRYRQNATWQGEICWVENEMAVTFRSALELLKLLDSAR